LSAPAILLTRPRAESRTLATSLRAEGWRPLIWPALTIAPTGDMPDLAGAQAVLFSSARAARAAPPAAIPAFCVGDATARAARKAGFGDVRSASGDAAALAALVGEALSPAGGPLAFVRGAQVAADLAGMLRARGFDVRETIAYAATPAGPPPVGIAAAVAEGRVAAAAFYSPRTAGSFAAMARYWGDGLRATTAVAISAATAASLAELCFARIAIAGEPSGAAMRAAIRAAWPGDAAKGCLVQPTNSA